MGKNYWTTETDKAILEYKRMGEESLYNDFIHPALYRVAEYYSCYFFTTDKNKETMRDTILTDLYIALKKLNVEGREEFFHYFAMVGKNSALMHIGFVRYGKDSIKNKKLFVSANLPEYENKINELPEKMRDEEKIIFWIEPSNGNNNNFNRQVLRHKNEIDKYLNEVDLKTYVNCKNTNKIGRGQVTKFLSKFFNNQAAVKKALDCIKYKKV